MDVLHDGPVPERLRLEEHSNIRAKFIAECDWDSLENAKDSFQKNNIVFQNCHKSDEVVLWNNFELFYQLHLLQLLDCFAYKQEVSQRLSIIFILMRTCGRLLLRPSWRGLKRDNKFLKNNSFLDNLSGLILLLQHLN